MASALAAERCATYMHPGTDIFIYMDDDIITEHEVSDNNDYHSNNDDSYYADNGHFNNKRH